jgi:hypothetical protein
VWQRELSIILEDENRRTVLLVWRAGIVSQAAELWRGDLPHLAAPVDEGDVYSFDTSRNEPKRARATPRRHDLRRDAHVSYGVGRLDLAKQAVSLQHYPSPALCLRQIALDTALQAAIGLGLRRHQPYAEPAAQ